MAQSRTYSIVLRPEPEGGFTVRVPALPEIVTHGENEQEALTNAREAIELSLEHRLAEGDELPESEAVTLREVTVKLPAASAA